MIKAPDSVKRYRSAQARFLKPVIMQFFATECPRVFGPTLREKLADELIKGGIHLTQVAPICSGPAKNH